MTILFLNLIIKVENWKELIYFDECTKISKVGDTCDGKQIGHERWKTFTTIYSKRIEEVTNFIFFIAIKIIPKIK